MLGHQSLVPIMNYLYSLYDALVSISVPSDKARAVVDAMERDMGTTLATKQDLLSLATREDLLATKQDLQILTKDVNNRIALLEQQFKADFVRLDQKIDTLDLKLTVKFGSMLFVGFGLTIAAIRLWV
jgi:hypothetical protein